jgi:hypothetical protein
MKAARMPAAHASALGEKLDALDSLLNAASKIDNLLSAGLDKVAA